MTIVLLDAKTLGDDLDLSVFETFGTFISYETTREEQTLERIIDADIITNKVVISSNMLSEIKKLKLICIAATGMNNVDLKTAKFQNIEVRNVTPQNL